jgi:hypothetical protein
LKSIAQFLATATPSLLEAALGFDKVVGFINSLLYKMVRVFGELNSTLAELEEVRSKYERLESSLQTYVRGRKRMLRNTSLGSNPCIRNSKRRSSVETLSMRLISQ